MTFAAEQQFGIAEVLIGRSTFRRCTALFCIERRSP